MKKPRVKTADSLVNKMDKLAGEMLGGAKGDTPLDDKVAVFAHVAKWIAIKNRIPESEQGAGIDEYRTRLATTQSTDDKRAALVEDKRRAGHIGGRVSAARRYGNAEPDRDQSTGDALQRIIQRIPRGDDGGDVGDRTAAGGEDDAVPVNAGRNSVGMARPAGTGDHESGDAGDLRSTGANSSGDALPSTRIGA